MNAAREIEFSDSQVWDTLQNSSIVFYRCLPTREFPLVFVSPNVEKVLGFTAEEFAANEHLWSSRIYEEDRLENFEGFREKIFSHESWVHEYRFYHKNGSLIWLRDELRLIRDEEGKPEMIAGNSFDISARKHTEEALRASRERYRAVVETVSEVIFQIDTHARWTFLNPAWQKLTGQPVSSTLGRYVREYVHPDDCNHLKEELNRLYKGDTAQIKLSVRLSVDAARIQWVRFRAALQTDSSGNVVGAGGTLVDITEQRCSEAKIREMNEMLEQRVKLRTQELELLRAAVAKTNDMLILTEAPADDPLNANIVYVNHAFEKETGFKASEVIGQNPSFLHGPKTNKKVLSRIEKSILAKQALHEEFINYRKNGEAYWVELDMVPFRHEEEDKVYWVGVNRNISERKEQEQEMQALLQEKVVLLQEIHHRVKNNLAVITGLLELETYNHDNTVIQQVLKESQLRVHSIAMIHEKLYQHENLSYIRFDNYVDELVAYILDSYQSRHAEITIDTEIADVALNINQAIPCGLMLNELVNNAFKHAFRGRDKGYIRIGMCLEQGEIKLTVEDDGVGLPADFEKSNCTSLGMNLVHTLAAQLEGTLTTSVNSGTRFTVTFPKTGRGGIRSAGNG